MSLFSKNNLVPNFHNYIVEPIEKTMSEERIKFLENVKVEDIHNDFFVAQEKLLKDAKEFIDSQQTEERTLYAKLHSLGFYGNKKAQESSSIQRDIDFNKVMYEKTMYYKEKYPLLKFITESQVMAICEKYNLLLGNTGDFIGEIPEKNLREIVNFKIKDEDILLGLYSKGYQIASKIYVSDFRQWIIESSLDEVNKKFLLESLDKGCVPFMPDVNVKGIPMNNLHYPMMKICAPEKEFNMTRRKIVGRQIEIDDPIVLYPVDMGFLVVSAWGEESKEVVNEINN